MEHVSEHNTRTPSAHYSAQQIAIEHEDLGIKEVTIRTRWFSWLTKVAPEPLLKTKQGFTELARTLFEDFAENVKRDGQSPEQWVQSAKSRYSHEWASAGVIDAELMPDQVGGALAMLQSKGNELQQRLADELEQLNEFVGQIADVDANFSQAEVDLHKARGAVRGIQRFKLETQSELEVYNQLRKQHLNNQ
ncbi:hypothetical protein IQ268_11165 [Oculatella sp. LEGE 06141]|uniref:hypothetical protein n=1 Tax=Oculatella sp. LEGE 06141 TaxID=1828648 RepID=UPI001880D3E5|nr:hypothetical protein [Oculatella sp. LEGE 06141]MBE9179121.1 hypothetical protein [Oculatella sp. LEGE 06141]